MNTARKRQKQDEMLRNVEIMRGLGLTENPLTQLASLVNTLNATQAPQIQQEQWGQEFGLRQKGQEIGQEENALMRMLQERGLNLQQSGQQQSAAQHAEGIALQRENMANDLSNRERYMTNLESNQAENIQARKMQMFLGLLSHVMPGGLPSVNPQALKSQLDSFGDGFGNLLQLMPSMGQGGTDYSRPGLGFSNEMFDAAKQKAGVK